MNRKDESLDAVWEREWLAGNKAGYRCLNKWPSFRWRAAFVYEVPSGNFVQLNSSSRDVFLNQWTYLLWAQFELRDYHGYLMYYDWAIEVGAKSWLEIFFMQRARMVPNRADPFWKRADKSITMTRAVMEDIFPDSFTCRRPALRFRLYDK